MRGDNQKIFLSISSYFSNICVYIHTKAVREVSRIEGNDAAEDVMIFTILPAHFKKAVPVSYPLSCQTWGRWRSG